MSNISGIIGTSWPWNIYPEWKYDEEVIGQALRSIILTSLGERKMSPLYGSECIGLIFENKGVLLDALIKRTLKLAIANNLTNITLLNIDIEENSDDNGVVVVNIEYEYLGRQHETSVEVS